MASDNSSSDVLCPACGGRVWVWVEFQPERTEWRFFGWLIRQARPERLAAVCKTCRRVHYIEPGTIETSVA